ncbi:retrovirus-related Pol polyprotein from transposon TNT 1-94 [Trichonephila clavipes]|nr:retrovirus-related Pol polyprotein from transposon TNT 1-94 [Trichonephila clavipes]
MVMLLCVLRKVFQKVKCGLPTVEHQLMTKHKNYFVDFPQFNSPKPVYVGNSDAIMAYGHGTVNIEIRINNKWERHHLTAVWYVPDISRNLFSISQTLKKGFKFQASKDECSLLRDHKVRMKG